MRQAGLLASAGLYAIQHNYEKLRLDHEHATLIADYLEQTLAGHADKVHVTRPETNMAFVRVPREVVQPAAAQCKERGVLIFPFDTTTLRMVPNLNHTREDIEKAMKVVAEVLLQLLK
ncbi:hypothetical protein AGDE_16937 [Angomonas deanei]|nr:hypothetical protein AGDE_16937 [Angomonas deanei]|eukprot:EPY15857.1 hypothetical protein AGDE_16937 [Angomonas deanei]